MIFDPQSVHGGDSSVVAHITAEVSAACGEALLDDPYYVRELALAVDAYLAEEFNGASIDSRYVVMLASRALSSLGKDTEAKRLVVFGTGLVKPAQWEVSGGNAMWILDLKQITLSVDDRLELTLFASLKAVLEAIADGWDESGGRGALGLRHVIGAATQLLGARETSGPVTDLVAEIKYRCASILEQLGAERGWQHVPEIIDLDSRTD